MHDIVDRIYEAAAIPDLWQGVLADVARLADAKASVLIAAREAVFNRWVVSTPDFAEIVVAHAERYPTNDRTNRLIACRHAGFLRDCDVYKPDELDEEPIFRDFLIPNGFGSGVATTIFPPSGETIIIHAERDFKDGPVAADAVQRLDELRPHFARAALLSARLEMERSVSMARALDLVGLPAAVLGYRGRLIAANEGLNAIVPSVVQDRQARIALTDPAADVLMEAAILQIDRERGAAVRSIPIRAREGRPPIIMHLVPIRGAAHDVFARATALLVATAVVPKTVPSPDIVQGLFDLTPAEAKLAALIASGHPPREASVLLGVTQESARTTLKRVFAKTATHRQADLVGLLRGSSL